MAAATKPPTTLKISIQTFGSPEKILDLFEKLNELGLLERLQDFVLNVGYYFEEEGRAAREHVEALLRDHEAVMKTKSFTDLGTKRKVSDTFEPAEEGDEDDETPLERWERQQGSIMGEVVESVVEQINRGALGPNVSASVVRSLD